MAAESAAPVMAKPKIEPEMVKVQIQDALASNGFATSCEGGREFKGQPTEMG
eukprot:s1364_g8.t1